MGDGFEHTILFNICWINGGFDEGFDGLTAIPLGKLILDLSICDKSREGTFDFIPPPIRYLIVISLLGAKPYSWVKKGVALLKLVYKSDIPGTNPNCILSGVGKIVWSELLEIPAPNSNWRLLSERNRDTNLRGTLFSCT